MQKRPDRPTGQVCAARAGVRPQCAKWPLSRASDRKISPMKRKSPCRQPDHGRIRPRLLLVLPFSVIGGVNWEISVELPASDDALLDLGQPGIAISEMPRNTDRA